MRVVYEYSHLGGSEILQVRYPEINHEIYAVINQITANRTKISKEKTMRGKRLFAPTDMNKQFKQQFNQLGFKEIRDHYTITIPNSEKQIKGSFKQIDFVKNRVLVEVQFGKYAFAVYNVCAKMTIFKKHKIIRCGIEIVPVKDLVDEMSSGIIYFEQFVWDLEQRGVLNIDIPVLMLGIAA